ncbi:MAG: hypothetical protein E7130_02010 [Rikenellaceae bacterium]|nr:hypothetical protein [Rikenellaceae bacterium]
MNSFAHIFIGKEFEQMVSDIGRVTYKYGDSAISYLHYYLFDIESAEPTLKKLNISSSTTNPDLAALDEYLHIEWSSEDVTNKSLTEVYRQNVFNAILGGVNRGSQNCLYVCIHLPFYKKSTFDKLSTLYQAMRAAQTPDKISFIGYCKDLAPIIEPSILDTDILASKSILKEYKQFKEKSNIPLEHRLILFQNAFQNGMPLDLDYRALVDVVSQLSTIYVDYYDQLYPPTMEASDLTSFGLASISLDKYKFVEYLIQRTILNEMEKASIMSDDVSVNDVFDKVRVLLKGKNHIVSDYLGTMDARAREEWSIVNAEKFIDAEIDSIRNQCKEIFKINRSMPMRTALLSALLQTKCDLFNQMVFDPNSPDINDLYIEAIDYFINNDKSHMFWQDEETPLDNPIKKIKSLSLQILNSESQIKDLKKKLSLYEEELNKSQIVDTVTPLNGDGFFRISDDCQYKLLPNQNEEPLNELYQPHDIKTTSLDLRANFGPIKNQGPQGSCLSFALTSIFEYAMRSVNHREEYDLSERFLYYNARRIDPTVTDLTQDTGLTFRNAIDALAKYGITTEALCKYNPEIYDEAPSDAAYEDAKKRLLRKALGVPLAVDAIKSALEDGYPVAASFTICQSFANINHGFIPMPEESEIGTDQDNDSHHAMVIVGFEDKLQCFLVRNSWGTAWGEQGYCYIPYSYIENPKLLTFACILSEIESVATSAIQHREIPALKLDDGDISIRYQTSLASLHKEQEVLADTKAQRAALAKQFEVLKQTLSNHNTCEEFILRTCEKTKEEQEMLKESAKREQLLQDQEYEEYLKIKRKLYIKAVSWPIAILLFVWLWNKLMSALLLKEWFVALINAITKILECVRDFFVGIYNYVLASEPVVTKPLYIALSIDWIHYIIIAVLILIYLYKGHKLWRSWRDNRDEHEQQISRLKKEIAAKQKEMDDFRFRTQVACKWIGAVEQLQTGFQYLYLNMTSRINNLRSWYAELNEITSHIELDSAVPNTSVLSKPILDRFYTDYLQKKEEFIIDFADQIDTHQISEEYLNSYKSELHDKVMLQLINDPNLKEFDISCHIATDKFANIAKRITPISNDEESISTENVKRQSDIFMHIRSLQRGVIMPSTYVFAPNCQKYGQQLRIKIGRGMDSYLTTSDMYRIKMLQTINLYFDECVIFQ